MNKIKLLNELEKQFENFVVHRDLITDLSNILSKSGAEKSFLSKLSNNLQFLSEYGMLAHTKSTNDFESLSNVENMYSMHVKGKTFNIRLLYSFFNNGTILIHGFKEEEGKRISDYSSAIPIAKKRYNELIKSMEEHK